MKKYKLFLITVILYICFIMKVTAPNYNYDPYKFFKPIADATDWMYTYTIAKNFVKDKYARRYADKVNECAWEYYLEPRFITHCISNESRFNWKAKGDYNSNTRKYESFGPMGVKAKYHYERLKKINNGELEKYFKERRKKGKPVIYSRYLRRIGYGVETGCLLWRDLLNTYNQDYRLMIIAYGHGPSHDRMKEVKANPDIIFNTNYLHFAYARSVIKGYRPKKQK